MENNVKDMLYSKSPKKVEFILDLWYNIGGKKTKETEMLIDSNQIVSMTEANQNFSKVVRQAEEDGCVVIFKNNKPKFVLLDVDAMKIPLTDSDDKLERAAKREVSRAKWL